VPTPRALSRSESKAVTRQALLDAALEILDAEGTAALTTINVTRRVGIAQSTFYAHFADMNDLLRQLTEHLATQRQSTTRRARWEFGSHRRDVERGRDMYRVPLHGLLAHPPVLRLVLRSRLDPTSPLGRWSRQLVEDNRQELIDDIVAAGAPHATDVEHRRIEMYADGVIALTETLALGAVDGRYPDTEEIVDVLVAFTTGFFRRLPTS
jgi:AcrR family transcriptional regulator